MGAAPESGGNEVVEFADYLRATVDRIDEAAAELLARRRELALRLDTIEAATSARVTNAALDYESRVTDGRPYESAENAEDVLTEAHARYGA